jgi:hypothetical protein
LPDPRRSTGFQAAVELMTAWLANPDRPHDLVAAVLERRIEEHPSGDQVIAAMELVAGMTHLCGAVLTLRELADGVPAGQTIEELALLFAETEDL